MKKNHINLFTPSLFKSSIYEIIYAALFKDYLKVKFYKQKVIARAYVELQTIYIYIYIYIYS